MSIMMVDDIMTNKLMIGNDLVNDGIIISIVQITWEEHGLAHSAAVPLCGSISRVLNLVWPKNTPQTFGQLSPELLSFGW